VAWLSVPYFHLWPGCLYHIFICGLAVCTIFSSVACLSVPYFSTLSHNRHDFQKKVIEHKMSVFIFATTYVWNISHSTRNCARYDQNIYRSTWKVPVFLVRFWWNLNFLDSFSKNNQIPNFIKTFPVEAELFHASRRTEWHDEAYSNFSQLCERA